MARRGRPRTKAGKRLDGRIGVLAQITEADKRARLAETSQVASQPHRRWARDPLDPRLATALGRFVIRHGLRSELFDAAGEWIATYRRWLAAKGVPDQLHAQTLGGGLGPSKATVDAWWRDIERVEARLREYGQGALLGVRHLCLDDCDLPLEAVADTIVGLRVVAVEMGRLPKGAHPFVNCERRAA
jgi:hypothetical protein